MNDIQFLMAGIIFILSIFLILYIMIEITNFFTKKTTNNGGKCEMTKYKCGHKSDTIIMNDSILGISAWFDWKDTVGYEGDKSQCWKCYCDELNKRKVP